MASTHTLECGDRSVTVVSTQVADGDFSVACSEPGFSTVRERLNPRPWTWLKQVHGTALVEVGSAGEHRGATADGAFTFASDCPIAVTTADCAPVVLTSSTGVAVVHAGWRGALGGIIASAAAEITRNGAEPVGAWLGPCIGVANYEFGAQDLAQMVDAFGDSVVGATLEGKPALNMAEVVSVACVQAGFPALNDGLEQRACTSGSEYFSHRTRGDVGRQTTVAWLS